MIYFIIWAVFLIMALGIHLTRDGERRAEEEYNVVSFLFRSAVNLWLMYMWGAFDTLFKATP